MGYRFSHAALGDLRDIVDYIFEQGHPGSAHSVANEIKRVCGLKETRGQKQGVSQLDLRSKGTH